MDYNKETSDKLDKVIELLKKMIEYQEKLYFIFSKYDSQYLVEMESEGFSPPS
tara:strand:+ start:324 stop:482 length:159 start_codon:yes stop_codon:yes gene_type:complete